MQSFTLSNQIQYCIWFGSLRACLRSRSGFRTGGPSGARPSAPSQPRWKPSRAKAGGASPRSRISTPPWSAGVTELLGQGSLVSVQNSSVMWCVSPVRGLHRRFRLILPPNCLSSRLLHPPFPLCPARRWPPSATCWPASTAQVGHKFTYGC